MMVKTLPHSEEAEQYFISAALLDGPHVLVQAINDDLTPRHFFESRNRVIYTRLISMLGDSKPIDLAALCEELKLAKEMEDAGGWDYLVQVSGRLPTTAQAPYFCQKIRELHTLRETIREAQLLIERCESGVDDVSSTLMPYSERLLALACGSSPDKEPTFSELIDEAEKVRSTMISEGGRPKGSIISFPWQQMDDALEPMQRGQLVVIGARPSLGKSSLSRQICCHCALQGYSVYFVTLEVNPVQVVLQMAATLAGVGVKDLSKVGEDRQKAFGKSLRDMKRLGFHISRRDRSIGQILAKARAIHSRTPLSVICVDYGGLIDDIANCHQKEKAVAIGRVTKALKKLAMELNCVVLLPWQLNRKSADDNNREPRLSDLRDSGEVEQDADKVLFVHRPNTDPESKTEQSETTSRFALPKFYQDIIQAKGRDDGTSRVPMRFIRGTASFEPAATPPEPIQGEF